MFQVGDRVVSVCNFPEDNDEIRTGSTGVVCHISEYDPPIGVRWDNAVCGHDCSSNCEYGFGWYVYPHQIELEDQDCGSFDCADATDIDALFS